MTRTIARTILAVLIIGALSCARAFAAPTTTIDGVVSPGNSPGCVVDHGNVTLSSAATLRIELAGITPCTEYDRYTVQQTLTLGGARLELLLLDGYEPSGGERFTVLEWGTLVGTFGAIDLSGAPLPPGLEWDTSSLTVSGEIIVTDPVHATLPVPAWAIGLGFLLLAALGNRSLAARRN